MDFNEYKNTYRDSIDAQIAFSGQRHEFFVEAKAVYTIRAIRQHLGAVQAPTVLDIGCGHGFMHQTLTASGCNVTGVETAAEVLERAREANPEATYVPYDGDVLPFVDGSFDCVLVVCVMHHVEHTKWKAFLNEANRVLKPGGLLVVFEHNPLNPATRYVVANSPIDEGAVLLTHKRLKAIMRSSSFVDIRARFILFTPFAARFFRRLDDVLGLLPLGAQYVVMGSKE